MVQYKLLGSCQVFSSKESAIAFAKRVKSLTGVKPEIRVVKDGVVQFQSIAY